MTTNGHAHLVTMPERIHTDVPPMKGRSLLTLLELTTPEFQGLVDLARVLKKEKRESRDATSGSTAPTHAGRLAGKNIALIFEKASTRTRCAFVVAAADEGGRAETLTGADIHLGAKEDIADTARVLSRFFDGIQFRGFKQDTVEALARYATVPVWNGLTDDHHPTQALADVLTLQEEFGHLQGRKLVYLGDAANNTCASLALAAAMMGMDFVMAAPANVTPRADVMAAAQGLAKASGGRISVTQDALSAVEGASALYTDVWISMGEENDANARTKIETMKPYQVNARLMAATGRADSIFLHCLPANKGFDVTEEVFESKASRVFEQAENRLHTIKALLISTLT